MPKFQYVANEFDIKKNKTVRRKGVIEAADKDEAERILRGQNLVLEKLEPAKAKRDWKNLSFSFGKPVIDRKSLCNMTRQLATLLQAGLPLVRGLKTLQRQAKGANPNLEKVLGDLATQVEGGATFSEALATHPKSFAKLYVSMIRAGEASGAMEIVLVRLAEFMEKSAKIAGKIKSAMMYPAAIMSIAGIIGTLLMILIVPKFSKMFDDMLPGEPMPMVTNMVIGFSNILSKHIGAMIGVVFGAFVLIKLFLKTSFGQLTFDFLSMKLPIISALTVRTVSARFCRTLGTLMSSGVAVLQALQIVKDTAGNEVVSRAIMKVHDAVKEGETMTKPLERTKVFPLMLISMVEVGEETGALPDMLNRVAAVYEDEVDQAVDGLTSMLEPLMIVFLAGVVGTIVVAMFAPMVKMIDKLGG